jgi:hypothetical protein
MAPNRKSLVDTLSSGDLAGLQDTLQSQYKPLTSAVADSKELQAAQTNESVEAITAPKDSLSVSYWDWPADAEVQQDAANIDLFSASYIEANLKKEAARWNTSTETTEETNLSVDEEPKHQLGTSYWD